MADDLETAITRTLSAAAERAPDLPPDVLHRVDGRRKRRRHVVIAGVAVLMVVAGSVATMRSLTQEPSPRPGPSVVAAPAARPEQQLPIADVWPQAVHTIAAKLADGRGYQPIELIDDNRLLVSTQASFEKANELWVIHLAEQEARRLARIPTPRPNTQGFASHFAVGSGHVVWWTSYAKDDKPYTEIWQVSVTGGKPTLVVTVPAGFGQTNFNGDRLAVANGSVYWSKASNRKGEHAVWRVSLTGGKPSKVPGTEGHYIVSLPWVAKPGEAEAMGCPPGQGRCEFDTSTMHIYTDLLNIDTGERRTADVSGMAGAVCGVTYCFELGSMWPSGSTLVRNRDGSNARVLPGSMGAGAGGPGSMLPGLDRFVVLAAGGQYQLYDLQTDQRVDLGPVSGSVPPGTWLPENRLLHWSINGGKAYAVVDLAAIG